MAVGKHSLQLGPCIGLPALQIARSFLSSCSSSSGSTTAATWTTRQHLGWLYCNAGKSMASVSTHGTAHQTIHPRNNLKQATMEEIAALMPFSWQIGLHRQRSIQSRGIQVWYKARSGPIQPSMQAHFTEPRQPSDSYLQLVYPFSASVTLRDQYRRFDTNKLRWGLLLEDMDTLAGDIVGLHAGLHGKIPATAFIDKISYMSNAAAGEFTLDSDLRVEGQVTWVGRSSMEVMLALSSRTPSQHSSRDNVNFAGNGHQQLQSANGGTVVSSTGTALAAASYGDSAAMAAAAASIPVPPDALCPHGSDAACWKHLGFAHFVMVMRDAHAAHSIPVPSLQLTSPYERALYESGQAHMERRKQKRDSHWRNKPPTELEVRLIHQLALANLEQDAASAARPGAESSSAGTLTSGTSSSMVAAVETSAAGSRGVGNAQHDLTQAAVAMQDTVLRSSVLMHSSDRNHFNKIFGGHLMRLAFEHAFATAGLHAGAWCDPVSMEDVAFLQPVPIGCLLQLRGKVVFTQGQRLRVLVEAVKLQPGTNEPHVLTNAFSFSFLCRQGPVHAVRPVTVVEALEYVMGHRQQLEEEWEMQAQTR